ncbi:hypothetical protein CP03DC29_0957B, partial [Chlamydia psittaci 03DC29]
EHRNRDEQRYPQHRLKLFSRCVSLQDNAVLLAR